MRVFLQLATLLTGLLVFACAAQAQTVKIASGQLRGVEAAGVLSWKGVPYAAPPVGDLRWAPPKPPAPWLEVKAADRIGPACPQPERGDGGGVGAPPTQSEDCLTLNVYAPAGAKNLPVMVWIHGGAFRLGYSGAPLYDGAEFARQGVVLVTINYRLGLLGFFAHPALTAAAKPDEPLGNYGLMDQIAALQWVQDNIAAFGGDPKNVTAFGESAGGASLVYLLTNPKAKGLFSKAIIESGGGLQRPIGLAENEQRGVAYFRTLGAPADASLSDLRRTPASAWVRAQGGIQGGAPTAGRAGGGLGFGPFIDGRLVTEAPFEVFQAGKAHDVPLIVGANSNEASVLATLGVPQGALALAVGPRIVQLRRLYEAPEPAEFQRQAMGDLVFVAPSRWVAGQAAKGAPSYLYYFDYVAAARRSVLPGANHGSEIPYVFQTWKSAPLLAAGMTSEDRAISSMMSACWVSFAKTGKPACAPAPDWPAYDPATDLQMEFAPKVQVRKPPRAAAFDLLTEEFRRRP